MSRIWRAAGPLALAFVAAGLVAPPAQAQKPPPERGGVGEKPGQFGQGDPRGRGEAQPADAIRTLEAELAKLRAMQVEVEAKLRQLREAPQRPMGPMGPGGFGRGGLPPFEEMRPEQLKELINHLSRILEE